MTTFAAWRTSVRPDQWGLVGHIAGRLGQASLLPSDRLQTWHLSSSDSRIPDADRAQHSYLSFTPFEWTRLVGFYGAIALLHLLGWGLYLRHSLGHPSLVGLGMVAYLFGLRHAFDADHIAAVDDTIRYLLQKGRRTLGVCFFFALGHSTVVLLGVFAIVRFTSFNADPGTVGVALIGATVSGISCG